MLPEDPTQRLEPDNAGRSRGFQTPPSNPASDETLRVLVPGQRVFNRYTLEAIAGQGGMGVVWRARDESLGETVALKFLPDVVVRDEVAVDVLKEEARRARRLTHPNIVRIHDFIQAEDLAAVSMEYVPGSTLARLRLQQPGKVFSVKTLAPLVAQLCAGLDYAHTLAKIVHRDFKPANVLVTNQGEVKIADFGIAQSLTETHTRLTGFAGRTSGTLLYVSPQQLMGEAPSPADDIYALGATLYELLTGRPPFHRGDANSLILQIREKGPLPLAVQRAELEIAGEDIPPQWEKTILACLAKQASERPARAGEIPARLGIDATSTQVMPAEPAATRAPFRRWGILGTAAALALGGIGYAVWSPSPPAAAPTPPTPSKAVVAPMGGALELRVRPNSRVVAIDSAGHQNALGNADASGALTVIGRLPTGRYGLRIEHPDCVPAERTDVEILAEHVTRLEIAQTPLPGEVRVFSVPSGADVRVNGTSVGQTPATLQNQPSEVPLALAVSLAGYRKVGETLTLKPGETRSVNVGTLVAESGGIRPSVTVRGVPTTIVGSKYFVDGQDVPLNDGVLGQIETGERVLEVRHPDYEPAQFKVLVSDATAAAIDIPLIPKPAKLTLKVTGAESYKASLDGKPVAVVDGRVEVPAKEFVALEVTAAGFKSIARTLSLPPNGAETLEFALERNTPELGRAWTVPDLGIALVPIAPGTFMMGSEEGFPHEKPLTRVTITKPFWLGRTEVTQRAWTGVIANNPSSSKGADLPVETLSWDQAMLFCRKLTERERAAGRLPEGYVYSLPTEAQWEYACRAGSTAEWSGDLRALAWTAAEGGNAPHPVGTKQPNAWGLHDMYGNVSEWCFDWYGDYPGGTVADYSGPASGSKRINRGGGWNDAANICRSANRYGFDPGRTRMNLGFRVALSPVIAPPTREREPAVAAASPAENGAAAAERAAGWRPLFDGKTLNGWRSQKGNSPPPDWRVQGGAIVFVGTARGTGDLVSQDTFGDFELSFEWKISNRANTGILYRRQLGDSVANHVYLEYQIVDNRLPNVARLQQAGGLWNVVAPSRDATKPVGEWNSGRIVARGWRIEHWMNEVKVVDVDLASPQGKSLLEATRTTKNNPQLGRETRGHIALQGWGDPVSFRNIKVRELTTSPGGSSALTSIFNGRDLTGWKQPSPNPFWRVEDGLLIGENDSTLTGAMLWTEKSYGDFALEFEARWSGEVDSGVEFRNPPGLQLQIGSSRSLKRDMTGSFFVPGGGGYPEAAQAKDATRLLLPGEWNSFRLEARGSKFVTWLNGVKVAEYTNGRFSRPAPLGLQIIANLKMKIEYRNIRASEL